MMNLVFLLKIKTRNGFRTQKEYYNFPGFDSTAIARGITFHKRGTLSPKYLHHKIANKCEKKLCIQRTKFIQLI